MVPCSWSWWTQPLHALRHFLRAETSAILKLLMAEVMSTPTLQEEPTQVVPILHVALWKADVESAV